MERAAENARVGPKSRIIRCRSVPDGCGRVASRWLVRSRAALCGAAERSDAAPNVGPGLKPYGAGEGVGATDWLELLGATVELSGSSATSM